MARASELRAHAQTLERIMITRASVCSRERIELSADAVFLALSVGSAQLMVEATRLEGLIGELGGGGAIDGR
jgi:hypothetical protein